MNTHGKKIPLTVELALTKQERNRGLMHRKKLGADRGMLFVFKDSSYRNFWMKNTTIPLSIAYIDTRGRINEIYDMKPLDISVTYPSSMPARYALEVNRGWFRKNYISRGCGIDFHGCIGQQDSIITGRTDVVARCPYQAPGY